MKGVLRGLWWFTRLRWFPPKHAQMIGGVRFYDHRQVKVIPTEVLLEEIQGAFASLTASGCDNSVRETVKVIIATDGPQWHHHGFGLYMGPFEEELRFAEPIAMRLLYISSAAHLRMVAAREGKKVTLLELKEYAYEAVLAFARRSEDADLLLRLANSTYRPSGPDPYDS